MRLLTVGSLPPEWGGPKRGGVATFHASLLTGLADRAAEVELVGVLPPVQPQRELPFPVFARPDDVNRASFYADLLERLRPDVVLMNHIANTIGVTHGRIGSPVPALGVIHSWHNITFRSGDEQRQARQVTAEALAGMAAIAAPSRHLLAEGRELGLPCPPIAEAIPNPLPAHISAEDFDASVGGAGRSGALFLGDLIPRKDPAALVEAAALIPGLRVQLVGEGELEASLRALVERLRLGERVTVAGALPGADHLLRVRESLLGAELLCVPSRSESFGLVFIEALACGTPVVGFGPTVREIRDAMGIEIGEPVEGGSAGEVAAAIERVRATDWDRRELRRATLEAFGLGRVTGRYIELLSRVVPGMATGEG